jgi:glycosyltransferase involved in cell wall biosynthesis
LFVAVARRLPKYAFVWIGNQKQPEFEYPENTYFMGNIPNAGAYTKFADLFFLPSNYEGLPIVIIEALSMGVPVVASAVGGISELLDGKNGYAVANQEELMAEKIEELLHLNAMTKQNVSQHAEDTYAAYFTVEKMSQAYEHIYQHMLSNIKVR